MANMDYVTENKLTLEANQQKRSARKGVLIFGILLALAALYIHVIASFFVLLATLASFRQQNGSHILRAGAVGEDYALSLLSKLPDTFTIYNQVDIPNPQSRTGVNEADIIVVGQNAVFVIEVKHNNGTITGSETDNEWQIRKVGRGGTAYGKTMRNPIVQVKKLVWLLSEDLKAKHSKAWVQGVVLFSHPEVQLAMPSSASVPVLRAHELLPFIQGYQGKAKMADPARITQGIARLKAA